MKVVATLSFSFLSWAALGQAADLPKFRHVTIDANVKIGYGTAIADMNGDKKPDIILCDARNIAWYENPSWKKHIIVENLTARDHVCIAVRDIDGDGNAAAAPVHLNQLPHLQHQRDDGLWHCLGMPRDRAARPAGCGHRHAQYTRGGLKLHQRRGVQL